MLKKSHIMDVIVDSIVIYSCMITGSYKTLVMYLLLVKLIIQP